MCTTYAALTLGINTDTIDYSVNVMLQHLLPIYISSIQYSKGIKSVILVVKPEALNRVFSKPSHSYKSFLCSCCLCPKRK